MDPPVRCREDACLTLQTPEQVVATVDGRAWEFHGSAFGMVAALIDGRRSALQIAALLVPDLETEVVYYVLEILRKHAVLAGEDYAVGQAKPARGRLALPDLIQVDRLFDIGCNRGQFLLNALRWWQPSHTVAVDMQGEELEWARRNAALCRLPGRIDFVACAVGRAAGSVDYWRSGFSPSSSIDPPSPRAKAEFGLAEETERLCRTAMRTIDDIRAEAGLDPVDLLKLDVEGHELPALSAGLETLARTSHLLIETTFDALRQDGLEAFCEFLRPKGFAPAHIINCHFSARGRLLVADVLFSRPAAFPLWISP